MSLVGKVAASLVRKRWLLALGAWFTGLSLLAAGLLARHLVALPAGTEQLGASLATLRVPADQGRWLAVHVLYGECSCSRLISEHLVSSERPAGWSEIVLWAGEPSPSPELASHGFRVRRVSRQDLARYGVESVPSLITLDPSDGVRYVGGYTAQSPGIDPQDLRILADSRSSAVTALPVFGCAVSERLRRALAVLPSL